MIGIRILCYIGAVILLWNAWASDKTGQILAYQAGFLACVLALIATVVLQAP